MSEFHDNFAAEGLPLLLELHGESVVYQDDGGDPVALTAIAGAEQVVDEASDDGETLVLERDLTFARTAGDFGGVATPSLAASVCVGGETYAVRRIAALTDSYCRLTLTRREAREISRGRYRRRV